MHIESRTRGISAEEMVEKALQIIKEKVEEFGFQIREIVRARQNSWLDRQKVDILVRFEDGTEIGFQVKSSTGQAQKFEQWAERRRRRAIKLMCSVVAHAQDSLPTIIRRVTEKIKLAFSKLKRSAHSDKPPRWANQYDDQPDQHRRMRHENRFHRVHAFRMSH